jgi:DNA-binding NtrC family response regulator
MDLAERTTSPPLRLVVVGDATFATYELPHEGAVVIGRSNQSDVRVDDPSITRRHALLKVGHHLELEDLGSANGTVVREQRLRAGQPVRIHLGEAFKLGTVLLMIQAARQEPGEASASDDVATRRAEAAPRAKPQGREPPFVIEGPVMRDLYAYVDRVAPGNIAVLISGETGVGKELVAERLHRSSPRRNKPFVRLNCAAFADSLLESELFGFERGAFTGAAHAKAGLLESADGGTVFLDEIGEMPLAVQAKVLRVIESKEVTRVGALSPRALDVRFVAATNRNLLGEIGAGRFREDLYFRLNAVTIAVPPLRERTDELPALATAFIARACADLGRTTVPELSDGALHLFQRYRWPGNVRELRNFIERAVLVVDGGALRPEHFPLGQMAATLPVQRLGAGPSSDGSERERIMTVMAACGGNQSRAAKQLGIARSTLVARLDEYGVTRPRKV